MVRINIAAGARAADFRRATSDSFKTGTHRSA